MTHLHRRLLEDVFYPEHDVRHASRRYRNTHHLLIQWLDTPCWICGIRQSDVDRFPAAIRRHWQLETHHFQVEWAAQNGLDLERVTRDWPDLDDRKKVADWVDSEGNMMVLCAQHHRAGRTGIHSITYPVWKLQRWQGDDQGRTFQFIPQTNWHTLVPPEAAPTRKPPEVLPQREERE